MAMSEIIKHGSRYIYKREGWYGKKVTCPYCKCQFVITEKTKFSHATGGEPIATVTCPECGNTEIKIKGR